MSAKQKRELKSRREWTQREPEVSNANNIPQKELGDWSPSQVREEMYR